MIDPRLTPAVSRRSLLAAAGLVATATAGLAGCTGGTPPTVPTPTASPQGSVEDQLRSAMETITAGQEKIGVAIRDLRSGGTWAYRGDLAAQSASMAKPMIVSMAMRKARGDHLEQPLPPEQAALATKAIENSDNDAADALWAWAGRRPAYYSLASDLGLKHTYAATERDYWSWTWTTPSDQVEFLRLLVQGGTQALTDTERAYLLDLMGKVQSDQTWGVGAPKSAAVQVQLKNGWVQFASTDNQWAVNSIGHVSGEGRDYLLAVMTRTPTFDTGRAYCDAVGTWVFSILGSGQLR